jgi:DNA-binding HxlR family transcriptional regulator
MGIFGDKWTLLVIRDLMFKGKRTFGEFANSEESIATNILADRLKRLEQEGMVAKSRDPGNGTRNLYRLTEKGIDLLPVMLELVRWAAKYDAKTEVPEDFLKALNRDPEAFANELRARIAD